MRRADRLFQIIQSLRRRRHPTTAQHLADELEISVRTVYRDIADLTSCGVPIDGEAGIGYLLREGFHLPPLMFNQDEIEALVLGAQIVREWTDAKMARAAADVLAKVEAALPKESRRLIHDTPLHAPPNVRREPIAVDMSELRLAIRGQNKVRLTYAAGGGEAVERVVRPLALAFYGPVWLLTTWCEMRGDFRSFRLDRIRSAEVLAARFEQESGKRLDDFLRRENAID